MKIIRVEDQPFQKYYNIDFQSFWFVWLKSFSMNTIENIYEKYTVKILEKTISGRSMTESLGEHLNSFSLFYGKNNENEQFLSKVLFPHYNGTLKLLMKIKNNDDVIEVHIFCKKKQEKLIEKDRTIENVIELYINNLMNCK